MAIIINTSVELYEDNFRVLRNQGKIIYSQYFTNAYDSVKAYKVILFHVQYIVQLFLWWPL